MIANVQLPSPAKIMINSRINRTRNNLSSTQIRRLRSKEISTLRQNIAMKEYLLKRLQKEVNRSKINSNAAAAAATTNTGIVLCYFS